MDKETGLDENGVVNKGLLEASLPPSPKENWGVDKVTEVDGVGALVKGLPGSEKSCWGIDLKPGLKFSPKDGLTGVENGNDRGAGTSFFLMEL